MKSRFCLWALSLTLVAAAGVRAEVPWHPYPPGAQVKSLPSPRDPGDFVSEAYRRILGREPGSADKEGWAKRLETDGAARDGLFLDLLESDEFFIRQCFLTLIGRAPRKKELSVRLAFLAGGGDRRDVVRNLLESGEYRSTIPPRGR